MVGRMNRQGALRVQQMVTLLTDYEASVRPSEEYGYLTGPEGDWETEVLDPASELGPVETLTTWTEVRDFLRAAIAAEVAAGAGAGGRAQDAPTDVLVGLEPVED